jgi:hypothetical protein
MAFGDIHNVELYIGEGLYRRVIGNAEVEELSGGSRLVVMTVNKSVGDAFGMGVQFEGTIPELSWRAC